MPTDELLAGRYRPLSLIGTGGMARVFLAEDERLGRQVAVKRLHADSPEDTARRFEREARIGASLNHQNLVAVYDVDTDGESVLIVMEYVEGVTLADELKTGPLDERDVATIVEDIARALDVIHAENIVHRDVKPANVLLRSKDGAAKLADLGIATVAESTRITMSGTVLGTAAYMAPEQLEGDEVGPAADVYSLAAVAFEALSGRKAREGNTPMEVAHRVVNEPAPDLRDAWPDADPGVAAVLARGLSLRPEDRHQRAGELAAELRSALERAPRTGSHARRATTTHRSTSRLVPAAVGLALVVAVAAVAFALTSGGGDKTSSGKQVTSPQAHKPKTQTVTAPSTQAVAPPASAPQPGQRTTPEQGGTSRPASNGGAQLNRQGYALMRRGDYNGAIPILQKAVARYPSNSKDLEYGYALYNLGRSLRLAGRPAEAVPILERRLAIPNQTATVQKELEAAKKQAKKG